GGVISPLLANIYLHWFDKCFHFTDGPAHWAKARLVRYADDFVVMARCQSPQLVDWGEKKLEDWLGLKNQPKQDADRQPERRRNASGLSGLPVSVRPRPFWSRLALSELGSVGEIVEPGEGGTDGNDRQPPGFEAHRPADQRDQPTLEGLDELLLSGLSV